MKHFECKDIVPNCDWETTGETEEEILQKAAEHGKNQHGIKEFTPELKDKVKSKISEIKAA